MNDPGWFILTWEGLKDALVPSGAAARTVLHIHVGLVLYLGVAVVRRRGLRSALGLGVVGVSALVGEWLDLAVHWPTVPSWMWRDSIGDVISTLVWPLVLFAAADRLSPAPPGMAEDAIDETEPITD